MNTFENLLKNKEKQVWLSGNNVRLFWQDAMEGYTGEINDHTRNVVCAGWNVITWNRSKPIELYFGDELAKAIEVFDANNH
jgi:hypothetical protein